MEDRATEVPRAAQMIELSAENVVEYLRGKGWIGPGPALAEELSGGVSNCVLRVSYPIPTPLSEAERREVVRLIVKQSRPRLRTRQEWFSDVARIHREEDAQRVLADALPGRIPRVLFSDRENCLYAMEHAHPDARPWKSLLLEGDLDVAVARDAGRLLRGIHSVAVPEAFSERTVFRQLRIDPFYRTIQSLNPNLPLVSLIESLEMSSLALCHGDFSPKNLLVNPGVILVDHETAHLGEPAFDIGFFASHLMLKAIRIGEWAGGFTSLIRVFLDGYADEAVIARALPHLGACLLARIDGTSPVDYLPHEWQKEAARSLGRIILLGQVGSWEAALAGPGRQ